MPTNIEWRPVPRYDGYSVSTCGQMIGPRGLMRPMSAEKGHLYVLTRRPGVPRKLFVHRAVLLAFEGAPPPGKPFALHRDDDPRNNDLGNLYWGSFQDNADDCVRNGRRPRGSVSVSAKLSEGQVREIRRRRPAETLRALASEFGVSHTAVRRACVGTNWRHLDG